MQLELFSSPGEGDSRYLVEASRPFLAGRAAPMLAYLAAATVGDDWLAYAEAAYRGIADVVLIANPILALEDGAWLSVRRDGVTLRRGRCWLWTKGAENRAIEVGTEIAR